MSENSSVSGKSNKARRSKSTTAESENGESKQYEVDEILEFKIDHRTKRRKFKVSWKGYASDEDTWEPEENLQTARETVDKYLKEHNLPLVFDYDEYKKQNQSSKKPKRSSPIKKTRPTSSRRKAPANDEDDDGSDVSTSQSRRTNKQEKKVASKSDKSNKEIAVFNRKKILGGGVPRWLGDDSSDDDKKKEDSNDMDETPAVDETIQENKNEEQMVVVEDDLKETRSETGNGDMLIKEQANTSANAAKKRKQKEISVPVEDVDKTNEFVVKRSNLPKSTNDLNSKINGNVAKPHAEKRSKRGTRQPNGTTSKNAAEGNHSLMSFQSSGANQGYFIARNNRNLEEVELTIDQAIDEDSRSVALFFAGFHTSDAYTIVITKNY